MFQTDQPTASNTLPTPAAPGTQGFFTNGNPASGVAATIVDADFLNMMMMELVNVVIAAGETPSKTTYTQVRDAIKRLAQSQPVVADTGTANAYAAANASPLSALPSTGFVQVVSIAHANTGASTYAPDGLATKPVYGLGLQPLQGGELVANGIATMAYVVAATVNSGNGAWILSECTGGSLQIAPATASNQAVQLGQVTGTPSQNLATLPATTSTQAVQFGQVSGVVGTTRNLVMSIPTSSSSATITADEIIVETVLGGLRYCLASFSKTINLATTGAGGMDTGTAPASSFVAIYAIYNPTTGVSALLAQSAAVLRGSVYSGANMPAGFTASALVSVWPTNASGQLLFGYQEGRDISFAPVAVLTASSPPGTTLSALSIANAAPANAVEVRGNSNSLSSGATTQNGVQIAADPNNTGNCSNQIGATNASQSLFSYRVPVRNNSQTIFWVWTLTGGTSTSLTLSITGYRI